ncbi:MAG: cytochrome c biogenesis protein CcsA [Planctomycetales bacterium]|nr:cytochrome c biogenesis protein CcsA [Planctomycetales bacterium]
MASTDIGQVSASLAGETAEPQTQASISGLLGFLASLKLTVALFSFSLVLVLAGTLAQIDHDVWYVIENYFRTPLAWIKLQVFFPRAWDVPGTLPFPGGWSLGAALGLNLLAAHAIRFKVTGTGSALWWGMGLIVLGVVLTYLVVQSGLDHTVESELSPKFANGLWHALRAALGGGTLALAYLLALNYQKQRGANSAWLWWLGMATCTMLACLTIWLFTHPEAQLDTSGLRILWQLIKATAAGLVLLAGCHWVFGRRAGIVLLHGGIALMMFSELLTGTTAEEANMQIVEGQTVSFAEDNRSVELAIVDKSKAKEDTVVVVPGTLVTAASESKQPIEHANLPFSLRVVDYLPNSVTRRRQPGESTVATKGAGQLHVALPQPTSTGVGMNQAVDVPSVYVELLSKGQESLGIYLLTPLLREESIEIEGKPYQLALRFKRLEKPYSIKLIDFRHDRYVGTDTPKNYSSEVQLIDPQQNVDRRVKIWMNNPLRYGGDTLYQASFDKNNPRLTVLQVVTNTGWMIPYVSCMLVATGMLAHFGVIFLRFARRQKAPTAGSSERVTTDWRSPSIWVPALIVVVFAGWALGKARVPKLPVTEMQIHEFGRLPLAYNGRIKPFDTLARNTLTVLSGREKLYLEPKESSGMASLFGIKPTEPAIVWLLDLISGSPAMDEHRVFRIENPDVLQSLGLEPRDGFRYSKAELIASGEEYMRQWELVMKTPEEKWTLPQRKFKELGEKVILMNILQESFAPPAVRTDTIEHLREDFGAVNFAISRLNQNGPRAVPPIKPDGEWKIMLEAERDAILQRVQQKEINEATVALREILDAYRAEDVQKFNDGVESYRQLVEERAAEDLQFDQELSVSGQVGDRKEAEKLRIDRVQFEAFFNHFNPFLLAMSLYLVAFVLAAGSWLGWTTTLNRSANWLLWFTFLLHTAALVARIYISGRPPVTNLYSSAVFIGWGAVLFSLVAERIFRFGLGNLLAAIVGFPALFIAHNLAGDGDTFNVLQAVLDTQFWLATHVVCITLGYSTTLLAGMLGVVFVVMTALTNSLGEDRQRQLIRMTYGTICFAIFFSFVGTVLGGLWADDSWGRFWGWDPKENGALLIVIWNALVLHARWGGMVQRRGLAILAIFGNVITAWSWFGVNQMGVGLHAYGETEGRTVALAWFVASQLAIMLLGYWPVRRASSPPTPALD